ncbi:MAG: type IV pilin N-terminal domain-containing protein [Methanoregula sp.]
MQTISASRHEHAISPVVGVMLMLVVTIIIAAVVSAVAGSFSATSQSAPQAIFEVHIHAAEDMGGFSVPTMTISEISGDPIPTKNLKISTRFTNTSGTRFSGYLDSEAAVSGNDAWCDFTSNMYSGVLVLNIGNRFGSFITTSPNGEASWFGNSSAVIKSGYGMTTAALFCGNTEDNFGLSAPHDNPGMDYLLGFPVTEQEKIGGFGQGSVVNVQILHSQSGKILYAKDILVE